MAECSRCGAWASIIGLRDGLCEKCYSERSVPDGVRIAQRQAESAAVEARAEKFTNIIMTTETAHNLPVAERLDIITAEVVVGMHLFKDIASSFRDTFGGRSKVMQDGLRDARKTALAELRKEAHALGADAVVGVDLDYSEISGSGKSMLFLVASGTAVKLVQH